MNRLTIAILAAVAFGLALAGQASAAELDPVKARTAAMSNIGFGASILVPMLKGEKDFDPVLAELALRMTQSSAYAIHGKFPDGSESKGANPDIWKNNADFQQLTSGLMDHAANAAAAKPKDVGELKAVYDPLLADCKACHEKYRIKY